MRAQQVFSSIRGLARNACPAASRLIHTSTGAAAASEGASVDWRRVAAVVGATSVAAGALAFNQNRKVNMEAVATVSEVIGNAADFKNGECYEVRVMGGKGSILVSRLEDKFYATGASCSHYSAPLVKGVLNVDTKHVSCPWHDAEFSLETGLCTNGPGLDAIPVYPIKLESGKVVVTVPKEFVEMVTPKMAKRDPNNSTTFAIVGGGPAALAAAETMRQDGFTGRIVVFAKEKYVPYDRPVLSKNFSASIEKVALRTPEWIRDEADIEFLYGKTVKNVHPDKKSIECEDGTNHAYDKVLIAVGADPRTLPCPGHDLQNIYPLRTPDHGAGVAQFAKPGTKVVVVGSSFIGMEAACSLSKRGADVTVIGMESTPFERVLGKEIGALFADLLRDNKLTYKANSTVKSFKGTDGKITGVELQNGEVLPCDCAVLGAGVIPNTKNAAGEPLVKGVEIGRDMSISVDVFLKHKDHPDLYCAGDIARFPYWKLGHDVRIEHWDVAHQQGRVAAKNMMGQFVPYKYTPFFWTMLFGRSVRYAGHCTGYDEVVMEGDTKSFSFVAYYVKGDQIVSVATMGRDPVAVGIAEAMKLNLMPTAAEVKSGKANSETILAKLKEYNSRTITLPAKN